jgi:hypothetical protein
MQPATDADAPAVHEGRNSGEHDSENDGNENEGRGNDEEN